MKPLILPVIIAGYVGCSLYGLCWGLHTPARNERLFPDAATESAWSAQRVARVVGPAGEPVTDVGADVDPDPTVEVDTFPQVLNPDERRTAEIFARYLLYSGQPDEMNTFRAIAAMRPEDGRYDPQMYQYGGLFIYPIAGALELASRTDWFTVAGREHYLAHPADFVKVYIVGRLSVVCWGIFGVWAAASLGTRLGERRGGLLAALLFAMLPVVVSLSHESKPHLPGCVLMLWAMVYALAYLESGRIRHGSLMATMCGLAIGMVVSSLWIIVLVPLVELLRRGENGKLLRIGGGVVLVTLAYAVTNPYVLINLFTNADVLASNFGNSTAMYDFGDLGGSMRTAWALLVAGSSPWIVMLGSFMLLALWGKDARKACIVTLPAVLIMGQFIALAAGKPGEYGRFALLPNAVLVVAAAAGTCHFLVTRWYQYTIFGLLLASMLAWPSLDYMQRFAESETERDARMKLAELIMRMPEPQAIGVLRDPGPYGFPPLPFDRVPIVKLPKDVGAWPEDRGGWPRILIVPLDGIEGVDVEAILADGHYALSGPGDQVHLDRARLTWAAKPLVYLQAAAPREPGS